MVRPYRIREVPEDSTYYRLAELDSTPLTPSVAGDRLKKFFTRDQLLFDHQMVEDYREQQDAAIKERQARAARSERLQELNEIMKAAKASRPVPEEPKDGNGEAPENSDGDDDDDGGGDDDDDGGDD